MAEALLCKQCGAPLPNATGTVVCSFCGTTNLVQLGTKQIRAVVRQVLAEGQPAPARGVIVAAVLIGLVSLGAIIAMLSSSVERTAQVRPVVAQPPPKPVPPSQPQPPAPPKPPPGLGLPQTIALGEGDALFAVIGNSLVKADRATWKPVWSTPVTGGEGTIVPLGDQVVFAGPVGVFSFDAKTGAPTGKYLLRNGGFKVSACAAGKSQVLVETVFDGTLRFDAATAKPTTGTAGCRAKRDLHCGANERCGFASGRLAQMDCRYVLAHPPGEITFCEVDGTKELVVVEHVGSTIRWKSPRGAHASTNPDFATVLDGLLITGDGELEAFDVKTGAHQWTKPMKGSAFAVVTDGSRLYFGDDDTIVAIDAKSGQALGRFAR
jgi:outer membrane protein assembly factor BamB